MPFQVSPGVNVSEIDLTTVVPAVSTTEGALAGHFRWGPVDQRVLLDSEDRLVNIYNKPNSNTATDFFTAANFLSYGNALYVNRVITNANNATTDAVSVSVKNEDHYNENVANSSPAADWIAKYPGELGNSLKVSTCQTANAWQSTATTYHSVFRNTNKVYLTTTASDDFVTGDILLLGPDKQERKVQSMSGNTITLTSDYTGETANNTTNLTRRWEYFYNFDNAPTTTAYANTVGAQGDAIHVVVVDEDGAFTGQKNTVLEAYESLSQASDGRTEQGAGNYYKEVINQSSPYIWWGRKNTNTPNAGLRADLGTNYPGSDTPVTKSFTKGKDGDTPTGAQKIAGWAVFKSAEDVDVSFLLGSNADTTLATHLITDIAESRKDCIAVLSPKRADVVNNNAYEGKERDDIIAFRDGLPSSSYAVIDSGWKYQYDKYNDLYRYVPLNGDTAGLMVQTDTTRDPWYSPAGFNRGNVKNVIRLAYNPPKADRDQLYKKGINPVVTFPGQGTVLFGDKTMLAKPSAFDRINVRRLFIVLEKAISTASKFTLFEFNDEFTRSQFRNLVEPFLRDVQGRRGITDFRVVCDSTNNTGEVIDRNEFIGDIYIKPARSINFIQLNFVAVRTGVEFSEVVGQFG
jgi:phage tail sheath protein FI